MTLEDNRGNFGFSLVTSVYPVFLILNILGVFTSYQFFLENGSTIFFLAAFLPTAVVLLLESKVI